MHAHQHHSAPVNTDERIFGPPEIYPEEFERRRVIGDGSFGTVFEGKCRGKPVAIKILHNQNLDEKTLDDFRKEVEIMSQIYHPNIVLFMGASTKKVGDLMIVTELMPKGDLESLLRDPQVYLSLPLRMRMAKETALGMNWLHHSNPAIIHRDLKTSNLLLDENLRIKLCDFGLSQVKKREIQFLKDGVDGAKGTPLWMAPEVLTGQYFNEKADVYSYGVVLWELVTRREPFEEFDRFDTFRHAVCIQNFRPKIPDDIPTSLKTLIESCWAKDPNQRPPFSQIIEILDHVMVDCCVFDRVGRDFWKKHYLGHEETTWSDFQGAFNNYLMQIDPLFLKTLVSFGSHLDDPKLHSKKTMSNSAPSQEQTSNEQRKSATSHSTGFNKMIQVPSHEERAERRASIESGVPVSSSGGAAAGVVDRPHLNPFVSLFHPVDYNEEDLIELHWRCLKAVLAEQPKTKEGTFIHDSKNHHHRHSFGSGFGDSSDSSIVTLERFGKVIAWLGPLVNYETKSVVLLTRVTSLLSKRWFHGELTTEQAGEKLQEKQDGTFLVRFSTTNPGYYTISKKNKGTVLHQRVIHNPCSPHYFLNNKKFSSLDEMVELSREDVGLIFESGGSPYVSLFDNKRPKFNAYIPNAGVDIGSGYKLH